MSNENTDVESDDPVQKLYSQVKASKTSLQRRIDLGKRDDTKKLTAGALANELVGTVYPLLERLVEMFMQMDGAVAEKFAEVEVRLDSVETPGTVILPEDAAVFREVNVGARDLVQTLREKATLTPEVEQKLTEYLAVIDKADAILDEHTIEDGDDEDDDDGDADEQNGTANAAADDN